MKNKSLKKGQTSLMSSRKKWKYRYYKEKGNSKQNKMPTPDYPQPIINEQITPIIVNGKTMYIKSDRKIKRVFNKSGIWYVEYEK